MAYDSNKYLELSEKYHSAEDVKLICMSEMSNYMNEHKYSKEDYEKYINDFEFKRIDNAINSAEKWAKLCRDELDALTLGIDFKYGIQY